MREQRKTFDDREGGHVEKDQPSAPGRPTTLDLPPAPDRRHDPGLPLARVVVGRPQAPTLVLLHGLGASALSQSEAITHWAQAGYRVVALDARGHGMSPRWSPQQLARAGQVLLDDVAATLSDMEAERLARQAAGLAVPGGRPVLIGHSMGAATAMVLAAEHPELVRGVVLCDPARYGQRSPGELLARGAARRRALETELDDPSAALARSLASDSVPDAEAAAGLWASQHMDPALLDTGVVAPEVPWLEAMGRLTVPTLLVTGDRPGSARVGVRGLAEVTALGRRNITTALVPGAGHDVRRSRPEGFYDAVDPWLASVLPEGPGHRPGGPGGHDQGGQRGWSGPLRGQALEGRRPAAGGA